MSDDPDSTDVSAADLTVIDNPAEEQLEVRLADAEGVERLAKLEYHVSRAASGDRLVIIHTEVPDELEGHGIGGALVRAALERAMADDLVVVPRCPFARGWLERHPDDAARVTVDWP